MDQNYIYLERNQVQANQIIKKFIHQYYELYPDVRSLITAHDFLDQYFEVYRKKITEIYIDSMAGADLCVEVKLQLVEQIRNLIGSLCSEVILESRM